MARRLGPIHVREAVEELYGYLGRRIAVPEEQYSCESWETSWEIHNGRVEAFEKNTIESESADSPFCGP